MNEATKKFIDGLKNDQNVSGVILFGSWARGNNREDSDVDLLIIVENGYQRIVENHYGQDFEIIYTTTDEALEYWKNNLNDAFNLWEVAKVVFDRNDKLKDLESEIRTILESGKKQIDDKSKSQLKFSATDEINSVNQIVQTDPTTAGLVLDKTVITLTEQYFDLKQLWTPAPKQRIERIKELDADFYNLLEKYYKDGLSFGRKSELATLMVDLVFS